MLTKLLGSPDAGKLEIVSLVERRQLVPQAGIAEYLRPLLLRTGSRLSLRVRQSLF
jgi:hypothetical protein